MLGIEFTRGRSETTAKLHSAMSESTMRAFAGCARWERESNDASLKLATTRFVHSAFEDFESKEVILQDPQSSADLTTDFVVGSKKIATTKFVQDIFNSRANLHNQGFAENPTAPRFVLDFFSLPVKRRLSKHSLRSYFS